ncbi:ClbS/DfsB family four-helix bundle protein [bacterium]|nr:ClbS/DfsB family four-helix bundle protein [bacterium]
MKIEDATVDDFSLDKVKKCLNKQWGTYVERYNALTAEEQRQYLEQQGYARLADLLAHVAAWWQRGMQLIMVYQRDSSFQPPDVDVDAFNAEAVASVRALSEAEVIAHYESRRLQMLQLVKSLTEVDLMSDPIKRQLSMDVVGHYEEHTLN